MHIVKLVAENVKRLHAVEIEPKGNLVQITGPNGAGKSAVLDTIVYGLAGKRMQPAEPIRRGAQYMKIALDLGDIVVKRTENANGSRQLRLERPNGSRVPTPHGPQTLLDELYEERTFGLQAFSQLPTKEQAVTLKRLAGLDFDELDGRRASLFDKRKDANRDLKALRARRDGIPKVEAPDEEVSVTKLSQSLTAAIDINQNNDEVRRDATATEHNLAVASRELTRAEEVVKSARASLQRYEQQAKALQEQVDSLEGTDIEAIQKQLADAEGINQRVREQKQRHALATQVAATEADATSLTAQIDAIDTDKAQQLADASFPVEGLGVAGDLVTLNALPLDQASSSDKLIVSAAVGLALHPELRIALERNGSLLDAEHLARLGEWADKEKVQVWIECVADSEGVGIYIEDGYARGAEALPVESMEKPK